MSAGHFFSQFEPYKMSASLDSLEEVFSEEYSPEQTYKNVIENTCLLSICDIDAERAKLTARQSINALMLTTDGFFLTYGGWVEQCMEDLFRLQDLAYTDPEHFAQNNPFILYRADGAWAWIDPTIRMYDPRSDVAILRSLSCIEPEPVRYRVGPELEEGDAVVVVAKQGYSGPYEGDIGEVGVPFVQFKKDLPVNGCFLTDVSGNDYSFGGPILSFDGDDIEASCALAGTAVHLVNRESSEVFGRPISEARKLLLSCVESIRDTL